MGVLNNIIFKDLISYDENNNIVIRDNFYTTVVTLCKNLNIKINDVKLLVNYQAKEYSLEHIVLISKYSDSIVMQIYVEGIYIIPVSLCIYNIDNDTYDVTIHDSYIQHIDKKYRNYYILQMEGNPKKTKDNPIIILQEIEMLEIFKELINIL